MPETGQSVENRSPLVSGDSDHPTPKRWARDYPAGYRMGQNPREHATQRLPGPVSGRRKRSERAPGTRRSRTSGRFVSGSLKHRSSDHPSPSTSGVVVRSPVFWGPDGPGSSTPLSAPGKAREGEEPWFDRSVVIAWFAGRATVSVCRPFFGMSRAAVVVFGPTTSTFPVTAVNLGTCDTAAASGLSLALL